MPLRPFVDYMMKHSCILSNQKIQFILKLKLIDPIEILMFISNQPFGKQFYFNVKDQIHFDANVCMSQASNHFCMTSLFKHSVQFQTSAFLDCAGQIPLVLNFSLSQV